MWRKKHNAMRNEGVGSWDTIVFQLSASVSGICSTFSMDYVCLRVSECLRQIRAAWFQKVWLVDHMTMSRLPLYYNTSQFWGWYIYYLEWHNVWQGKLLTPLIFHQSYWPQLRVKTVTYQFWVIVILDSSAEKGGKGHYGRNTLLFAFYQIFIWTCPFGHNMTDVKRPHPAKQENMIAGCCIFAWKKNTFFWVAPASSCIWEELFLWKAKSHWTVLLLAIY